MRDLSVAASTEGYEALKARHRILWMVPAMTAPRHDACQSTRQKSGTNLMERCAIQGSCVNGSSVSGKEIEFGEPGLMEKEKVLMA